MSSRIRNLKFGRLAEMVGDKSTDKSLAFRLTDDY